MSPKIKVEAVIEMTGVLIGALPRWQAARLYWALADVCGAATERELHPRQVPLFELFDALYELGAADWSQEPGS